MGLDIPLLARATAQAAVRRLFREAKFAEWQYRSVEQSVTVPCRPALFDPDQIGRVQKCGFGRTVAGEVEKLVATSFQTTPARVADLRDVVVLGGHVFHAEGRNLLKDDLKLRGLWSMPPRMDHVSVPNTFLGQHFFGHWLRDDCSGFEVAQGLGPVVSVERPVYRDAPAYERLLDQSWRDHQAFSAARATFVSDVGFSPAKAERLRALRARLRAKAGGGRGSEIVFIRRGVNDPLRNPLNEAALVERLRQEGVRIVDVDQTVEAVLDETVDARIIIGLEGSQLAHAVYQLREGGALVVLQSPHRFYNPHHEWCRLLGMRYATVIGTAVEGGFEMDQDEVLRMIDRVAGLEADALT